MFKEEARGLSEDSFKALTPTQQIRYIKEHPNSKYAKESKWLNRAKRLKANKATHNVKSKPVKNVIGLFMDAVKKSFNQRSKAANTNKKGAVIVKQPSTLTMPPPKQTLLEQKIGKLDPLSFIKPEDTKRPAPTQVGLITRRYLKGLGLNASVTTERGRASVANIYVDNLSPDEEYALNSKLHKIFVRGMFDGMQDCYVTNNYRPGIPQVDYMYVNVNYTPDVKIKMSKFIESKGFKVSELDRQTVRMAEKLGFWK